MIWKKLNCFTGEKYGAMFCRPLSVFFFVCFFILITLQVFSLPLEGYIEVKKKKVAQLLIYPRYVELYDGKKMIAKAGIINHKGQLKIFVVERDQRQKLIGYVQQNQYFNLKNERVSFFESNAIFSYIYSEKSQLLGRVKCVAWQEICAAIASALLNGDLN